MRRSFKAATVFAGTAVLAGGYAPAAHAASNTRICGANDTGGISHWLHLFYPNNDHPAECTHGEGYEPAKGIISAFCAGGTRGKFFGKMNISGTMVPVSQSFSPANNSRISFSRFGPGGLGEVHANLSLTGISVFDADSGLNYKCTS